MNSGKSINDLCMSCGFCCDGTLFGFGVLKKEDEKNLGEFPLLTINKDKTEFEQPCPYFDSKCTIYDKTRPSVCSTFYCKQIKNLKEEKKTIDEVSQSITKIKAIKKEVYELININFPQYQGLSISQILKSTKGIKLDSDNIKADIKLRMSLALLEDKLKQFRLSKQKKK